MVKTSPSNAAGVDLIPGLETKIPICLTDKKTPYIYIYIYIYIYNRNNTVTNSIKTLKMVHIKKNLKKRQVNWHSPELIAGSQIPRRETSKLCEGEISAILSYRPKQLLISTFLRILN